MVVVLSFALTFHAVFHSCGTGISSDSCSLDNDGVENSLGAAFGTFQDSFITVFTSALGGPDFGLFDTAGGDCRCNLPETAVNAGKFLMVMYLATVAAVYAQPPRRRVQHGARRRDQPGQ